MTNSLRKVAVGQSGGAAAGTYVTLYASLDNEIYLAVGILL